MPDMTSRRQFLAYGAAGALVVACHAPAPTRPGAPGPSRPPLREFRPSAWVRVGSDGRVTIAVGKSEMGQGVRTALPAIVADELEVDLASVVLEQASPGPAFKELGTGGSRSVRTLWAPLRRAGAAAREVLRAAGAARWGVPVEECRAERGSIVHGPTGRRLGYGELAAEASKLPVPDAPPLKARRELRLVGTDLSRVDGPAIVRGTAAFSADVRVEGQAFAVVLRCPVFGGKPLRWGEAEARRVPGVLAVVRISSGLAVVGTTSWAALAGGAALEPTVEWDEGPHREHSSADAWAALARGLEGPTAWLGDGPGAGRAIEGAARRVRAEYAYPYQAHAPLETRNATAHVRDDGCEIWAGTQGPNRAQDAASKLLGIPPEKVIVHVPLLGGAFGQKGGDQGFVLEAVEVSRAMKMPVQVFFTRKDDIRCGRFHPASLHRLEAGLGAGGALEGWRHVVATPSSTRAFGMPATDARHRIDLSSAWDTPYEGASAAAGLADVDLPAPVGAWRGVANTSNVFARECFVDEVALAAGEDPLAFRLRRLRAKAPLRPGGSVEIDPGRLVAALEAAARAIGWGTPLPAGAGRGLACNVYEGHTYAALAFELAPGEGGRLVSRRAVCAVDAGIIINPSGARAQVEGSVVWGLSALGAQITLHSGRVEQSSYRDFPVLRLGDTPRVETILMPSEAPPVGLGEPVVPLVAPAFLNALYAATKRRVRRLPLGPEDIAWPFSNRGKLQ